MPLPAALPWVALGLQALGGFFTALGQEDPEFHEFDPELKDRYSSLRQFRIGQHEVMQGAVAAVDTIQHGKGIGGQIEKVEKAIKREEGRQSVGGMAGDAGQALQDRIKRRDEAQAQSSTGTIDKTRELIKKERRRG